MRSYSGNQDRSSHVPTTVEPIESGAEDIGASLLSLTPREIASRKLEDAHKAAEFAAINRRLDRDRIIRAALDSLESASWISTENRRTHAAYGVDYLYIAGAAELPIGHGEPNRADYVRDLLAEIRGELSPQVR